MNTILSLSARGEVFLLVSLFFVFGIIIAFLLSLFLSSSKKETEDGETKREYDMVKFTVIFGYSFIFLILMSFVLPSLFPSSDPGYPGNVEVDIDWDDESVRIISTGNVDSLKVVEGDSGEVVLDSIENPEKGDTLDISSHSSGKDVFVVGTISGHDVVVEVFEPSSEE